MQVRNLSILVGCQLVSATGMFVMVTLGGIIGAMLGPSKALATLPLSMMVVAVAVTTVPAAMLMQRLGRRRGFMLASLVAAGGCLLALYALQRGSFLLYVVATMLFGVNAAFTHQYRYAAAESVAPRHVPRAVSFVLLGAIGGAFLGRELTAQGQDWLPSVPYGGAMLALSLLFVLQALLFLAMTPLAAEEHDGATSRQRSLGELVRQPLFLVAVLGGIAAYGVMTLIMTATPLSMHLNEGHSLAQTSEVIRAHVLAMYIPSLVAGFVIERLGVTRMMFAGAIALLAASLVGLQGHAVMHYWWALVLLGVGWNFLYVGGTTMLTYTYAMSERFQAQAVNEFMVFGMSATASLLAGTVMHFLGWNILMLVPLPVIALVCAALFAVRRDPDLRREALPMSET